MTDERDDEARMRRILEPAPALTPPSFGELHGRRSRSSLGGSLAFTLVAVVVAVTALIAGGQLSEFRQRQQAASSAGVGQVASASPSASATRHVALPPVHSYRCGSAGRMGRHVPGRRQRRGQLRRDRPDRQDRRPPQHRKWAVLAIGGWHAHFRAQQSDHRVLGARREARAVVWTNRGWSRDRRSVQCRRSLARDHRIRGFRPDHRPPDRSRPDDTARAQRECAAPGPQRQRSELSHLVDRAVLPGLATRLHAG
jgi:hypothetical protein